MFNEEYKRDFIKNNYGKISCEKIMKQLHISYNTLIKYAKELNIYKPKKETIIFDDEKIEFIKKNYKKMGAAKLAEYYNCSEKTIYKYAKKLNKTNTCNRWSTEEKELIKNYYSSSTLKQMQIILKKEGYNRSIKAIEGQAKKLQVYKDTSLGGEYLLSKDIMEIMNFSKSKISKLFLNDKIISKIYRGKRIVTIDDFITYLQNHQDNWNCKDVDLDYIKMICSTECMTINKINKNNFNQIYIPNWLNNKINFDLNNEKKQKKNWTISEINIVLNYKEKGFSYSEIAKKVNRSYGSVYEKISEYV